MKTKSYKNKIIINNLIFRLQKQFHKISVSAKIQLLILIHIILILFNVFSLYNLLSITENDSKMINESGIIRGSIQKIVKLETNNIEANEDINNVDDYFKNYLKQNLDDENFVNGLKALKQNWDATKTLITRYRTLKDFETKAKLIENSEHCWNLANHTVGLAQYSSETKHKLFNKIYYILIFDFILIMCVVVIIYSIFQLKIEKQAKIDPLTKVYNRNVFYDEIKIEIQSSIRHNNPLSIIILDIDFFKKINDTYGHDEGDKVLKEFAQTIKSNIRIDDILCRFGGEEFIIIAPFTDMENGIKFAEKLRIVISNYHFTNIGQVTASLGITTLQNGDSTAKLIKRADEALYLSKSSGRNKVSFL